MIYQEGGCNMGIIEEHVRHLDKSGKVIEMLVNAGANYNVACTMNKWIAKKTNIDKVLLDLQAITRSEDTAREIMSNAYMVHHCVPYK